MTGRTRAYHNRPRRPSGRAGDLRRRPQLSRRRWIAFPQAPSGRMKPLLGMEVSELREELGPGQPEFRARQVYHALYGERVDDLARILTLPAPMRRDLAASHTVGLPKLACRYESSDGTKRYLLELDDRRTIEAVLMPEPGRSPTCISTQVGCPVDCKFCMTALMGLERNLTAGEIVGQVLFVARENGLLGERETPGARLNIVMMGMGEPLLNLENVLKATRILVDPRRVGVSEK